MTFEMGEIWTIAAPSAMVIAGLALSVFFGLRMHDPLRRARADREEQRLADLDGWAAGAMFIAFGSVFLLPADLAMLSIPIGLVWLALFLLIDPD